MNSTPAHGNQIGQVRARAVLFAGGFAAARGRDAAPGVVLHHLGSRIVAHRQLGRAQALELVAQPRGFLEIEIGGASRMRAPKAAALKSCEDD